LSDTHCVMTSSSASGGGLKMCLFSATETSNYQYIHILWIMLISFTYEAESRTWHKRGGSWLQAAEMKFLHSIEKEQEG
jgi:hypothetical protein